MQVTVTDPRKTAPGRSAIFAELAALTATWDQHTLIPDAEKNRALALGKQLNEIGGRSLMQDAYYHAKARNRCASVLQYYWHGIGEWLSWSGESLTKDQAIAYIRDYGAPASKVAP